jgi:hypothetical protein
VPDAGRCRPRSSHFLTAHRAGMLRRRAPRSLRSRPERLSGADPANSSRGPEAAQLLAYFGHYAISDWNQKPNDCWRFAPGCCEYATPCESPAAKILSRLQLVAANRTLPLSAPNNFVNLCGCDRWDAVRAAYLEFGVPGSSNSGTLVARARPQVSAEVASAELLGCESLTDKRAINCAAANNKITLAGRRTSRKL